MRKPRGFKILFLLELTIQLQRRASRVSTKLGCLLQSGKLNSNPSLESLGLGPSIRFLGNFPSFHFLSAVGVEGPARQLFARVAF